MTETSGWAEQWQGGLCPVGALGGLPIRGSDYLANPPLEQLLALPGLPVSLADRAAATAAWSAALGGPVVLARRLDRARVALLVALDVAVGEPVDLPVNATRALVEAVKARGARPRFRPLEPSLGLEADRATAALLWAQPVAGLSEPRAVPGAVLIVDHAETLPMLAGVGVGELPVTPAGAGGPVATLWGLHLAADPAEAGALIAFAPGQDELAERVAAGLAGDGPDPARALAQLARLGGARGLAARQRAALAETWSGLHEAAGLALLPSADGLGGFGPAQLSGDDRSGPAGPGWPAASGRGQSPAGPGRLAANGGDPSPAASGRSAAGGGRPSPVGPGWPAIRALAHGVAVQVPLESEPSTFYSYLRGENTPVRWLPELRPVHYAAVREPDQAWRDSAVHLARWLLVPVGPDYSVEEVRQAVLGVVKASDYLGVRWRVDPARAASYARAMVEQYGLDHDAYRPVFRLG